MRNITRSVAAGLLITALLCGCGSSHEGAQNATAAKAAKKHLNPADALSRSMVGAVTQTKPGTAPIPVTVKFGLGGRPDVGQPLQVNLQLLPTASNLDRIFGRVEGEEGLEIVNSGELAEAQKPVENTPIDRAVEVMPKKDGIYTLTATISVDMGGSISTQTFTFPVIAGAGFTDLGPKPQPAAGRSAAAH